MTYILDVLLASVKQRYVQFKLRLELVIRLVQLIRTKSVLQAYVVVPSVRYQLVLIRLTVVRLDRTNRLRTYCAVQDTVNQRSMFVLRKRRMIRLAQSIQFVYLVNALLELRNVRSLMTQIRLAQVTQYVLQNIVKHWKEETDVRLRLQILLHVLQMDM